MLPTKPSSSPMRPPDQVDKSKYQQKLNEDYQLLPANATASAIRRRHQTVDSSINQFGFPIEDRDT